MTVYRAVNLAWHLGGDAALLRSTAKGADVLVLVECRDKQNRPVDVRKALGVEWWVWQNLADGARSGTAIAVRKDSGVKRRRVAGSASRLMRLSVAGRRVQSRYLRSVALTDDQGPVTVAAAHLPLKSTGKQDAAEDSLRRWWKHTRGRRAVFGDGNQPHAALRRALGAQDSAGEDVMFAIWSTGWPPVRVTDRRWTYTDHAVLTFTPKEK